MNTERENEGLKTLGRKTEYKSDYAPEVLETFQNKHPENDYWVQFNCPEFTSLCPITGQPDFAEIKIMYIPGERMVESKSLKLYLFSFRNHGDFHEDCINIIMKDLVRLMDPKYIEVIGLFTPRGGIRPCRTSINPNPFFVRRGFEPLPKPLANHWQGDVIDSGQRPPFVKVLVWLSSLCPFGGYTPYRVRHLFS